MAGIRRFEEIKAWQNAREMVREIYRACRETSLGKDFGLRDQLCRAAVSGMTNIAEGFGRKTDKDFAHFLDMARGSCIEVQSLLYVALDAGYLAQADFARLYEMAEATVSMIGAFTSYVRGRSGSTPDTGRRTE
jgi:four helix bundle protein